MRKLLAISAFTAFGLSAILPATAQTVPPGQTVNVTPNQQTTQATAVSNPTGQNISQQNNFYDPGQNSFGPGISCTGPYVAGSVYRNDSSNPGSVGVGGFANVGGTVGVVVPVNGYNNKMCQQLANEIVLQRQLDTCMSMAKQGFAFDPKVFPKEAARCAGVMYTGHPISSANPVSPSPPPTVITVPANPSQPSVVPVPGAPRIPRNESDLSAANVPVPQITVATPAPSLAKLNFCQRITDSRKKQLIHTFKTDKANREEALELLHAACVPDSEILAAL